MNVNNMVIPQRIVVQSKNIKKTQEANQIKWNEKKEEMFQVVVVWILSKGTVKVKFTKCTKRKKNLKDLKGNINIKLKKVTVTVKVLHLNQKRRLNKKQW